MKKLLIIAIALSSTLSWGQEPTPEPIPSGPLLNPLPSNTRCVIAVSNPGGASDDTHTQQDGDGSAAKGLMRRITLVNAGGICMETVEDMVGKISTRTWILSGYSVSLNSALGSYTAWATGHSAPKDKGAANQPVAIPSYPGMECVSRRNFVSVSKSGDKRIMSFKDDENQALAYVSVETRLPLAAMVAGSRFTYQFSQMEGAINVPPEAYAAIKEEQARVNRANIGIP